MWHYEYTIDDVPNRVSAESFEACLTGLLRARAQSRLLSVVKIFEGGTTEFGSGERYVDSVDPVD